MSGSTNIKQLRQAIEEEKKVIQPVNLRCFVESRMVGALIGKKGCAIQHLQNTCGAHMTFLGDNTTSVGLRLLHIDGPPRNSYKALSVAIKHLIQQDMRYERTNRIIGVNLVLPDEFIQCLQSTNKFVWIARESNTEITIKSQFLPRSTERVVRVTIPDLSQIHHLNKALELLVDLLQQHRGLALSAGTAFYVPLTEDSHAVSQICNIPNEQDEIYHL